MASRAAPVELHIKAAPWAVAAPFLVAVADPDYTLEEMGRDMVAGAVAAYTVDDGAGPVAAFLLRVESLPSGEEAVIVAAASRAPRGDLTRHVLPGIEALARAVGCRSVRFHTGRPGLGRKAESIGYRLAETVYRKDLF